MLFLSLFISLSLFLSPSLSIYLSVSFSISLFLSPSASLFFLVSPFLWLLLGYCSLGGGGGVWFTCFCFLACLGGGGGYLFFLGVYLLPHCYTFLPFCSSSWRLYARHLFIRLSPFIFLLASSACLCTSFCTFLLLLSSLAPPLIACCCHTYSSVSLSPHLSSSASAFLGFRLLATSLLPSSTFRGSVVVPGLGVGLPLSFGVPYSLEPSTPSESGASLLAASCRLPPLPFAPLTSRLPCLNALSHLLRVFHCSTIRPLFCPLLLFPPSFANVGRLVGFLRVFLPRSLLLSCLMRASTVLLSVRCGLLRLSQPLPSCFFIRSFLLLTAVLSRFLASLLSSLSLLCSFCAPVFLPSGCAPCLVLLCGSPLAASPSLSLFHLSTVPSLLPL